MIRFSGLVLIFLLVSLDPIFSAPFAEKGAKGPFCKNPKARNNSTGCSTIEYVKGHVGDQFTEDCVKFTCIKVSKKVGVWSQGPAM